MVVFQSYSDKKTSAEKDKTVAFILIDFGKIVFTSDKVVGGRFGVKVADQFKVENVWCIKAF